MSPFPLIKSEYLAGFFLQKYMALYYGSISVIVERYMRSKNVKKKSDAEVAPWSRLLLMKLIVA